MKKLYGGIEAGGTKFVCVVASGPGQVVDEIRYMTTMPEETLGKAVQFFKPFVESGQISAATRISLERCNGLCEQKLLLIWTSIRQP
jgi:hypothetical protein